MKISPTMLKALKELWSHEMSCSNLKGLGIRQPTLDALFKRGLITWHTPSGSFKRHLITREGELCLRFLSQGN